MTASNPAAYSRSTAAIPASSPSTTWRSCKGPPNILGMAIERQRVERALRMALDRQSVLLEEMKVNLVVGSREWANTPRRSPR